MTTPLRAVALLLGASLAGGCATATSTPRSGSSLKQDRGPRGPGGLPPEAVSSLKEYMAAVRHLSARPITTGSTGAKAEAFDPRLAAALRPDGGPPLRIVSDGTVF